MYIVEVRERGFKKKERVGTHVPAGMPGGQIQRPKI